ncbi:MAG: hypothetical protein WA885_01945 [Phormidesmis sp.]
MRTLKKISRLLLTPIVATGFGLSLTAAVTAHDVRPRPICEEMRDNPRVRPNRRARLFNASDLRIGVYSDASFDAELRRYGASGDSVWVVDMTRGLRDCYHWYLVDFDNIGEGGWVRSDLVHTWYSNR